MLTKYKERYSPLLRFISIVVICLFSCNDVAFALAPKLALTQEKFEEEYLAKSVLLTEASATEYIQSNTNNSLVRYEHGKKIIGVRDLLKNIGQLAKIDMNSETAMPVIYVDTNYFNNATVIGFELYKIDTLKAIRERKGFTHEQMAKWLIEYINKADPDFSKTTRQIADEINAAAHKEFPGVRRLYDRIKAKYKKAKERGQVARAESLLNFVEMYDAYKRSYRITDKDDKTGINLAAHEPGAIVPYVDPKTAIVLKRDISTSNVKAQIKRAWVDQNAPILHGKKLLTISMEGNIPEFKGLPAQRANTQGGLGAYFGDKFDGLDQIGMDVLGMQPGYTYYDRDPNKKIDYDQMVKDGILEEVLLEKPLTVWNGVEDPVLQYIVNNKGDKTKQEYKDWISCQDGWNVAFNIKVYKIKRAGSSTRYLLVSPIFDYLYPDDNTNPGFGRIHRFCQEVAFGRGVYELCKLIKSTPDILHLNEGHTVVAAAEMRTDVDFDNMAIVYTNHTLVRAGLEQFWTRDVRGRIEPYVGDRGSITSDRAVKRLAYMLGPGGEKLHSDFVYKATDHKGNPIKDNDGQDVYVVDFSTAAVELADVINAVSEEHAIATKKMFDEILRMKRAMEVAAANREKRQVVQIKKITVDVEPVLNGSGRTWVADELLKMQARGLDPDPEQLWAMHERSKKTAYDEVFRRTEILRGSGKGIRLDPNLPTQWAVRRLVGYKSQYLMYRFLIHILTADKTTFFTRESLKEAWYRDVDDLRNSENNALVEYNLDRIFGYGRRDKVYGLGMQVVIGAPEPVGEGYWDWMFKKWMDNKAFNGRFVYINGSDSELLKMQAVGSDICVNMPAPLLEACGTSDQRSGLNGGINIAVRGAGPVEWITDYKKRLGKSYRDGSGFLIGAYTKKAKFGADPKMNKFYRNAPADILAKCELAVDIFYNDKQEWKRLMHNSYMASMHGRYKDRETGEWVVKKAVTAEAMEQRYALDVYSLALRKKRGIRTIAAVENAPTHAPGHPATFFKLLALDNPGATLKVEQLQNMVLVNPGREDERLIAESTTQADLGKLVYAGLVRKEVVDNITYYQTAIKDIDLAEKIYAELASISKAHDATKEAVVSKANAVIGPWLEQHGIPKELGTEKNTTLDMLRGMLNSEKVTEDDAKLLVKLANFFRHRNPYSIHEIGPRSAMSETQKTMIKGLIFLIANFDYTKFAEDMTNEVAKKYRNIYKLIISGEELHSLNHATFPYKHLKTMKGVIIEKDPKLQAPVLRLLSDGKKIKDKFVLIKELMSRDYKFSEDGRLSAYIVELFLTEMREITVFDIKVRDILLSQFAPDYMDLDNGFSMAINASNVTETEHNLAKFEDWTSGGTRDWVMGISPESIAKVFSDEMTHMQTINNDITIVPDISPECSGKIFPISKLYVGWLADILISNSIGAAKENVRIRMKVKIFTRKDATSGKEYLLIQFSDNGNGMSQDVLAKVRTAAEMGKGFEYSTKKGVGTGQGVTIIYDIVRRLGGDFKAEDIISEEGVGTTFTMRIPMLGTDSTSQSSVQRTEIFKHVESPAKFLSDLKNNELDFGMACTSNEGIVLPYELRALMVDLGIFVPIKAGSGYYRFSDMMLGKDLDYTRTLINALQNIDYSFTIEHVRELIKMAVISEMYKEFAVPPGKTLYHIIEQDVIPRGQQDSIITEVNKTFYRDNTGPERIVVLSRAQKLPDLVAEIRAKDPSAIIDIALSNSEHIAQVGDDSIKKIVFTTQADFIQLEGIIKALRALHDEDRSQTLEALKRIYTVMAGMPPQGELPVVSGVYVFNLPKISKENLNDIPRLNKQLLQLLTAA